MQVGQLQGQLQQKEGHMQGLLQQHAQHTSSLSHQRQQLLDQVSNISLYFEYALGRLVLNDLPMKPSMPALVETRLQQAECTC